MSRDFDRFMVHVDIGTDEKLAGLSDVERLCHIAGVLAIAAKAHIRGCLLVGDTEAQPRHIAKRADVSERVAASTLAKLKDVGVLIHDNDLGCWRVHNWAKFNPDPKRDATAAERQQRRRDRVRAERDGHAAVTPLSRRDTRDGHAPEVEGGSKKEESPPSPPVGGRGRDTLKWKEEAVEYARRAGVDGEEELLCRAVEQATSFAKLKSPEEFRTFAAQHFESLTVEVAAA